MQLTLTSPREEGATVGELARRLGYRAEAAFARACKRVIGVLPGTVKRAPQARPDAFQAVRVG